MSIKAGCLMLTFSGVVRGQRGENAPEGIFPKGGILGSKKQP